MRAKSSSEWRWHDFLDGFVFVWKKKPVLGAISLDLFAVLFGGVIALYAGAGFEPDALVVPWWTSFWGVPVRTVFRGVESLSPRTLRTLLCHNVEDHESGPVRRFLALGAFFSAEAYVVHAETDRRKLELRVPDDELNQRRAAWKPDPVIWTGGYQRLYIDHVLQADQGADLDFLVGCRGAGIPRESH